MRCLLLRICLYLPNIDNISGNNSRSLRCSTNWSLWCMCCIGLFRLPLSFVILSCRWFCKTSGPFKWLFLLMSIISSLAIICSCRLFCSNICCILIILLNWRLALSLHSCWIWTCVIFLSSFFQVCKSLLPLSPWQSSTSNCLHLSGLLWLLYWLWLNCLHFLLLWKLFDWLFWLDCLLQSLLFHKLLMSP